MSALKNMIDLNSSFSLNELKPYYEKMLITILDTIISRMKASPSVPYINTKLNLITGKDFEQTEDSATDFKSSANIYGWIQGRGLESLVAHADWLKSVSFLAEAEKEIRILNLHDLIRDLTLTLELVRAKNQGHLFFTFGINGAFFKINDEGQKEYFEKDDDIHNMTDLFYAKGLGAASNFLGDVSSKEEAKAYLRRILDDIDGGVFQSDQVSFDPKNKVKPLPGVQSQGVRMIAIGALALFAEIFHEDYWYEKGCEYICYVFENFCNYNNQFDGLQQYDFVERINKSNAMPYEDDRGVLSDPGHSLEFIGLALKLLLPLKAKIEPSVLQKKALEIAEEHFMPMFMHCFEYGFAPKVGGIVKAFDLKSRKPINDDMPWWNLPETMRAGAELIHFLPNKKTDEIKKVVALCNNAFVKNFVNEKVHMMAYQTINKNGEPIDIIPATPDADPGYHTGLSIIDFLK